MIWQDNASGWRVQSSFVLRRFGCNTSTVFGVQLYWQVPYFLWCGLFRSYTGWRKRNRNVRMSWRVSWHGEGGWTKRWNHPCGRRSLNCLCVGVKAKWRTLDLCRVMRRWIMSVGCSNCIHGCVGRPMVSTIKRIWITSLIHLRLTACGCSIVMCTGPVILPCKYGWV